MSTLAPPNLNRMYAILDPYIKSLRRGGIVGDTRHVAGGGYHISRNDLRSHGQGGDYSIQAPADKRGSGNYAAAIDLTMSDSEMVTVSRRLKAACEKNDDRIEPIREFIGTINNQTVCGFNRYRTGRATGFYPSDYSESSHLWHVHVSFFRAYCNDLNSIKGVAEVIAGLAPGKLGWKHPAGVKGSETSKPKPSKPKAIVGPQGQRTYVMYVTKNGTHSYAKPPAVGKVTATRKKGFKVRGYPVRRDGRYLRTLWGNDYPIDSLSHSKPKK